MGKVIRIDDVDHVVIGVMPAGAQFPEDADLWTPITVKDVMNPEFGRSLLVFARLADGVTLAAAQSEVDGVVRRAVAGKVNGAVVRVRPFLEMIGVYEARAMLYAMMFAVGFVLLIVCGDVANLLLGRAAARAREISIRIAIGAGRVRIIRQLLVESVMLSTAGGAAGWLVAVGGLRWFENMTAQGRRPSWIQFTMDARGFAYLAAISIGAGILFGLAPALQLARVDVNRSVKDGGRGAEGPRSRRLAGLLVGFQMALCVVLLAASGLMIHSTVKLYNAPLAIDPANVLTMRIDLPETKYATPDRVAEFYRALKTTLGDLPGVTHVSLTSHLPLSGWRDFPGQVENVAGKPGNVGEFSGLVVDPNYFGTLGVRLQRGWAFQKAEGVVVNASFAAKFWPGQDPLGKRLRAPGGHDGQPWMTVIGVAADVQQNRLSPLGSTPLFYLPYDVEPQRSVYVLARTAIPPGNLVEAFRRAVQSLDQNLPAQDVMSLENYIAQQRLNAAVFGKLFAFFAAIALVLAWVGLYAVVAHGVSQRTQEIGVRVAMGGTRRDIFSLVVKQGMRQVLGGFAVGLPLALLVTRGLSRDLVGVSPSGVCHPCAKSDPGGSAGRATPRIARAFADAIRHGEPARCKRAFRVCARKRTRHAAAATREREKRGRRRKARAVAHGPYTSGGCGVTTREASMLVRGVRLLLVELGGVVQALALG
jgi:predicted permease